LAWLVGSGPAFIADSIPVEVGRPGLLLRSTRRYDGEDFLSVVAVDHSGRERYVTERVLVRLESLDPGAVELETPELAIEPGTTASSGSSRVLRRVAARVIIRASDTAHGP